MSLPPIGRRAFVAEAGAGLLLCTLAGKRFSTNEEVSVATLNEGDFFGEMALFTGEPRTANVLALEETEVLEIGHGAMKRVFDTNPDLVESLSFIMAERRQGLASQTDDSATSTHSSAGILSAIKRFFGI